MPRKLALDSDRITVTDADLGIGDKDTSYTLKPLTREVYKDVAAQNTKKVPNPRTRAMESVTDWTAVTEDLLDYAIEGWTGITLNGEPAPCTRENKLRLDGTCATALLDKAGLNQVTGEGERRAESFRSPAVVR